MGFIIFLYFHFTFWQSYQVVLSATTNGGVASGDIAVDDITFTPECQIYTGGDFPVIETTAAPMSKCLTPLPPPKS